MDLRLLRYFVAVVEERHMGRAATQLHMTQPPLSRAIKQLEQEFGSPLLDRTTSGVAPTVAGQVLYEEAKALLAHADEMAKRVAESVQRPVLRLGTLADSAVRTGPEIAAKFLANNAGVQVVTLESDFTDPSAGLRHGRVDLALTRLPFDTTNLSSMRLRADPVGVVTRTDDPIAGTEGLTLEDLTGRVLPRFPDGTDARWQAYWAGGRVVDPQAPVVRTGNECLQVVLWNAGIGLAPMDVHLPEELTVTPLLDMEPSWLALVWRRDSEHPLVEAFAQAAADVFGRSRLG